MKCCLILVTTLLFVYFSNGEDGDEVDLETFEIFDLFEDGLSQLGNGPDERLKDLIIYADADEDVLMSDPVLEAAPVVVPEPVVLSAPVLESEPLQPKFKVHSYAIHLTAPVAFAEPVVGSTPSTVPDPVVVPNSDTQVPNFNPWN